MKNLKVGDKVRCKNNSEADITKGNEYKIKVITDRMVTVIDDYGRPLCVGNDWFNNNFEELEDKDLPLAVRVTNEREFRALMTDYEERLSYHWMGYYKATEFKPKKFTFPCAVAFKNSFAILWDHEEPNYTLISFLDYVKIIGLILPSSIQLAEGATATLSDGRIEFDESVMSLAKSDIINLYNLIQ